MNICRSNPEIERIIAYQKEHSVPTNLPIGYYSNTTNIEDYRFYLQQWLKPTDPAACEQLNDPEYWSKIREGWEKMLFTGEEFMSLPEEQYFNDNQVVQVFLETLDCADRRAGVQWRKSIFHNHNFFELLYVYRGHCSTTISGESVELTAGDICMYNLQAVHQLGISSEEDAVFCILIKKDLFQHTLVKLQSRNSLVMDFFVRSRSHIQAPGQHLIFHPQEDNRCEAILQMIIEEVYRERQLSQEFLQSLFSALLVALFHQYYDTISQLSRQESGTVDVVQVVEYIGNHLTSATLEDTAKHFGYTPRSMIRFIKKYTNRTFQIILRDMRLSRATELLQDSTKSIQEIATEIGYNNRSYLHKVFQERYGLTPVEYRQKLNQEAPPG